MKKVISVFCLVCLFIGSLSTAVVAAEEKLTNDSIIEMHKLGLGDSVVSEKIKTTPCAFDVGLDAIKKLKEAGITDSVIQAMLSAGAPKLVLPAATTTDPSIPVSVDPNDPKSPHPSGIYLCRLIDGKSKMTKVEPSAVDKVKSVGGVFALYGEKIHRKAQLNALHADLQINEVQPTFYFYFVAGAGREDSSPDDFALAEFQLKKDVRRLVIGEDSLYDKKRASLDPKAMVNFTSEKLSPGIYKVVPVTPMTDGEYCFLLTRGSGSPFVAAARHGEGVELYCFGVQGGLPAKKK